MVSGAEFKDNWELSQARALSVVRFMISDLGSQKIAWAQLVLENFNRSHLDLRQKKGSKP